MNKLKSNFHYKEICTLIEKGEGMTHETLAVKCRDRELVTIRQLAMYFCRKFTGASHQSIGSYYGKDHATCLHAVKAINNLIDTDKIIRAKVLEYTSQIIGKQKLDVIPVAVKVPYSVIKEFAYTKVLTAEELSAMTTNYPEAIQIYRAYREVHNRSFATQRFFPKMRRFCQNPLAVRI